MLPQNDRRLVEEILHKLKFSSDAPVQIAKAGEVSLQTALLDHLQITRLSRKMIEAYAAICQQRGDCSNLINLLEPEQQSHLDAYTSDRGLIDLLYEYPDIVRSG